MLKTNVISTEIFLKDAVKKIAINIERAILLDKIATTIAKEHNKNKLVNLNFICTHNSRRSQLGQVWSFYIANYFNLNISAYSGGTEVTAFHRNTVKTLQKVGFTFDLNDFSHQNPKYSISFDLTNKSILGFSKRFDHSANPEPFIAITTCNNADVNCPFIPTASDRFHLPFVDPKASDNTELKDETYLNTNRQIAAEVFYLFSKVKDLVS